jgi:hypothetical protein
LVGIATPIFLPAPELAAPAELSAALEDSVADPPAAAPSAGAADAGQGTLLDVPPDEPPAADVDELSRLLEQADMPTTTASPAIPAITLRRAADATSAFLNIALLLENDYPRSAREVRAAEISEI